MCRPYYGLISKWETGSEWEMVGFRLWRSEKPGKRQTDLGFFPQRGSVSVGATYTFVDGEVEADRYYYYWLEVLNLSGRNDSYGPGQVFSGYAPPALQNKGGDNMDSGWTDFLEGEGSYPIGPTGGCGLVRTPNRAFGSLSTGLLFYLMLLIGWFHYNHQFLRRQD